MESIFVTSIVEFRLHCYSFLHSLNIGDALALSQQLINANVNPKLNLTAKGQKAVFLCSLTAVLREAYQGCERLLIKSIKISLPGIKSEIEIKLVSKSRRPLRTEVPDFIALHSIQLHPVSTD